MFRLDHKTPAQPLGRLAFPDRPDQFAERRVVDDLPAVRGRIESFGVVHLRLIVHARTLAAPGCALGETPRQIGDELFGIGAGDQRAAIGAEPAHRFRIGRDLARLAHGLRIVGREDELRECQFLDAEAHPVGAPLRGVIGPGPAGNVVIQPVIEIMVERFWRAAAVAVDFRRAPFVALLKAADAAEIAADAAGKMRELNLQRRQFVEQAGIDDAHRRRHQREFPAQHAAEIVGAHAAPADHPRQRMDEDVEAEIGACFPERSQFFGVERLILKLGRDDDAGKAQLDGAALQFGRRFRGLERRHMREPDEAAGMILLRPAACDR